jgi:glucose/arabinose dehydrogenase
MRIVRRTRIAAGIAALTLASSVLVVGTGGPAAAASVSTVKVKGGLNGPAAFTFTPKGVIVYAERGTGEIRYLNPATDHDRLLMTIPGVNGSGERGALGVALHPRWPQKRFVYVYVTRSTPDGLRNQIVRINDAMDAKPTMKALLSVPASADPYHNGGRILFGPDHKLYAIVGDGHDPTNAQDRTNNLRGKILRLNPDGSIPGDNPGGHRWWAYGIRNSFGFAFDPQTGSLWETENGPACNDELNLIVRGGNYAWGPHQTCGGTAPNDTNRDGRHRRLPEAWWGTTIGITGAVFCDGCGLGASAEGDLFLGACCDGGMIQQIELNGARDGVAGRADVGTAPGGAIYSMEVGPDGSIYFSDYEAIYRIT